MKRQFSTACLSGILMVLSFGALAASVGEPVQITPIQLAGSEMPLMADNSRFAFMPGKKASPNKRSMIDKISDKLEESRRVRENKQLARKQEKARQSVENRQDEKAGQNASQSQ